MNAAKGFLTFTLVCIMYRSVRYTATCGAMGKFLAALRALRIVSSLGSLLCGVIREGLLLALFLPARPLLFVQCESPYNSVPNAFLPELAMVSDEIMSGQFDEIYDFFSRNVVQYDKPTFSETSLNFYYQSIVSLFKMSNVNLILMIIHL